MSPAAVEFSFEFFPPRNPAARARLDTTIKQLSLCQPEFFSVTFGAGGSTRDHTFETLMAIRQQASCEAIPHISCIGLPIEQLKKVLLSYRENGFTSLVALRGDLPSGSAGAGSLCYASELVALIRRETGAHFRLFVGCYPEFHPQSFSADNDLDNFKRKVDAGADAAITQYFFNADAYFRFLDSCRAKDIDIPILPGIMPITNSTQLLRFSAACGAEVPRWIARRLHDFGDDSEAIRRFGIDVGTALCARLIDNGVTNIHVYTMNQAAPALAIMRNLA